MCQPRAVFDTASDFAVACIEVYNVHVSCNCYPNSVMYSVCVMGV